MEWMITFVIREADVLLPQFLAIVGWEYKAYPVKPIPMVQVHLFTWHPVEHWQLETSAVAMGSHG